MVRTPPRRLPHRRSPRRRRRLTWPARIVLAAILVVLAIVSWAILARHFAPTSNTALTRFDVLIVLGSPADDDGNPSPVQLARVGEAVHEYQRGVAPGIILTGGPAHNQFVEARVMARAAEAEGIPESAVFLEPLAVDTIKNACYSTRIMRAHGWSSAEVVSSDWHLQRAAMIFSRFPIEWRVHSAPPVSVESAAYTRERKAMEILKTVRYLVWTRQSEKCEP